MTIAGLIATIVLGFLSTPVHAAQHILLALATVIIGLFSQSMTMFFFIGTGKQLKDKTAGSGEEAEVKRATRELTMKVSPAAGQLSARRSSSRPLASASNTAWRRLARSR